MKLTSFHSVFQFQSPTHLPPKKTKVGEKKREEKPPMWLPQQDQKQLCTFQGLPHSLFGKEEGSPFAFCIAKSNGFMTLHNYTHQSKNPSHV